MKDYHNRIMVRNDLDETECGELECGLCGVPNPMDTDTKKKCLFGLRVCLFHTYQQSLVEKFGVEEAKKKCECEFNRVSKILKEKYHYEVKTKWYWNEKNQPSYVVLERKRIE